MAMETVASFVDKMTHTLFTIGSKNRYEAIHDCTKMICLCNFYSFQFINSCREELKQRFGITRAFLATHSGLTRWMDFQSPRSDLSDMKPE